MFFLSYAWTQGNRTLAPASQCVRSGLEAWPLGIAVAAPRCQMSVPVSLLFSLFITVFGRQHRLLMVLLILQPHTNHLNFLHI